MTDQIVPLTQEEINALVSSGEVTLANMKSLRLTPEEQKMVLLANAGGTRGQPGGPPNKGVGEALFDATMLDAGLNFAPMAGKLVTGLAEKALPKSAKWIGSAIGAKLGHPFAGWAAGKAAEGGIESILSKLKGRGEAPPVPKGVSRVSGPMADRPSMFEEVAERVPKGVQNDFRGPVTFEKGPPKVSPLEIERQIFGAAPQGAYSPNISTGATVDDIFDLITGLDSRQGVQTPLYWHGSEGPMRRRAVENLKKATSGPRRRSPK